MQKLTNLSKYILKDLPLIEIFDAIRDGFVSFDAFEFFINEKTEQIENNSEIQTLKKELEEALETIQELEEENKELKSKLESVENDFQKKFNAAWSEGYESGYEKAKLHGILSK